MVVMTDKDIIKLAAKLTKSLATSDDIREVKEEIRQVKEQMATKGELKKVKEKVDYLNDKTSVILELVENINEDHEKRLKRLERSNLN